MRDQLADWDDPAVQLVYSILVSEAGSPGPGEHWEGWCARRIVAALAEIKSTPGG